METAFSERSDEIALEKSASQIFGAQARSLGNSRQHLWSDLFVIVERKDVVRPAGTGQRAMRANAP